MINTIFIAIILGSMFGAGPLVIYLLLKLLFG